MQSIEKASSYHLTIQNSKFITYLFPIDEKEQIDTYIENIRKKEKNATHVCYGYRFGSLEKCFDDGEPSGTAGSPILHVLKQKDLDHILCIVVRYFGGIKLGSGGLYRAYASSCKEAILQSPIVPLTKGYKITIVFSYMQVKLVDFLLKSVYITQKKFDTDIFYEFLITEKDFFLIKERLQKLVHTLDVSTSLFIRKQ